MTKLSELKKKFRYVNNVEAISLNTVCALVNFMCVNRDKVKILSSEISWKWSGKTDFFDIKTWSTFDNSSCISLVFRKDTESWDGRTIVCRAVIHNGSYASGLAEDHRFTVAISLPSSFLTQLSYEINHEFNNVMREEYKEYLVKLEEDWIAKRERHIIYGERND